MLYPLYPVRKEDVRAKGQNMQKNDDFRDLRKDGERIYRPTLRPHACTMCVQSDKTTRRAISRFMASRYIAKIYITTISAKVTDPFTAPVLVPALSAMRETPVAADFYRRFASTVTSRMSQTEYWLEHTKFFVFIKKQLKIIKF